MTTFDAPIATGGTQTERSRAVSWSDPSLGVSAAEGLSGLDYPRLIIEKKIPAPPIANTIGFAFATVAEDRPEFTLEPAEYHCNPIGSVHGSVYAALLDSACSCAVHTMLPAGGGEASGVDQVLADRDQAATHVGISWSKHSSSMTGHLFRVKDSRRRVAPAPDGVALVSRRDDPTTDDWPASGMGNGISHVPNKASSGQAATAPWLRPQVEHPHRFPLASWDERGRLDQTGRSGRVTGGVAGDPVGDLVG
jgi:hypothetical protein